MIEVNEYVRTKDGISKVIENVDKYVTEKQICVDFYKWNVSSSDI